jgi:hypothetical protein
MIEFLRVFSLRCAPLLTMCFTHSPFAARYAEVRRFAAKNLQAVENDLEKFSRSLNRCAETYAP